MSQLSQVTMLGGSDSRMEDQIYKHSIIFGEINCSTYFLISSRTITPASLSIFFTDPSTDYVTPSVFGFY